MSAAVEALIREHAPQWFGTGPNGDRLWRCSCGDPLDLNARDWPQHMARLIDELGPQPVILRPDEAEHGHTWRLTAISRMSAALSTEERPEPHDWQDADWWGPMTLELELRAFDLPQALRLAAEAPLVSWNRTLDERNRE